MQEPEVPQTQLPASPRRSAQLMKYAGVALPYLCVALVMITALVLRVKAYLIVRTTEPDPDCGSYIDIAKRSFIFNTESREPLYIWMTKFALLFTDNHALALRMLSMVAAMVAVALIFYCARRWFGLLAATVAGLAYAVSPGMVFTATRGLREEWVIVLLLWFVLEVVNLWGKPFTWKPALRLAVPLALSFLLRVSMFTTIVPLLAVPIAWSVWANRNSWKEWLPATALALVVSFGPTVPYLLHCKKLYGDPFFVSNGLGARFYANQEFAGIHPDFPTQEEVKKDGYAGGPITLAEYIFKYHPMSEVVRFHIDGTIRLCATDMPLYFLPVWKYAPLEASVARNVPNSLQAIKVMMGTPLMQPLSIVPWRILLLLGYIALLFYRPGRILAYITLLFHVQVLFLVSLREFDWRLVTSSYPLIAISWGALAALICTTTARMINRD